MAGVEESRRRRLALLLVAAGAVLTGVGGMLMCSQRQQIEVRESPIVRTPAEQRISDAKTIQQMLFLLLVLVGIFAVASFAFLRWSRHFRGWMLSKPRPPTPSDDVWAMHRLPDEALEPDDDDEGLPDEGGPSPREP